MVVPVMKNSGEGFNIRFNFIKKMNVHQGNCCFLRIDKAWGLQNLGIILENKLPPNLRLENISIIEVAHLPKKMNKNLFEVPGSMLIYKTQQFP